jgi:hypothetical protein
MLDRSLGEKVAEAGINWGEVALRLIGAFLLSIFVCLLLIITLLPLGRQLSLGDSITLIMMAGASIKVWAPVLRVVQTLWRSPHLVIYQKGVFYKDRHGKRSWTWHELSHYEVKKRFGQWGHSAWIFRYGLFAVYVYGEELPVFQINRLFWNSPQMVQLIVTQLTPQKEKTKRKAA